MTRDVLLGRPKRSDHTMEWNLFSTRHIPAATAMTRKYHAPLEFFEVRAARFSNMRSVIDL